MGGWSEWTVFFGLMVVLGVGVLAFYASVPLFLLGVAALAVVAAVAPSRRDVSAQRRLDPSPSAPPRDEGGR